MAFSLRGVNQSHPDNPLSRPKSFGLVSDAKFWVGRGDKPSPQGIRIPDENGKTTPLRSYDHKTIVLTLPGVSFSLIIVEFEFVEFVMSCLYFPSRI